jgi:hypothetical protein
MRRRFSRAGAAGAWSTPRTWSLVRAGATFVNGKLIERPGDEAPEQAQPEAA